MTEAPNRLSIKDPLTHPETRRTIPELWESYKSLPICEESYITAQLIDTMRENERMKVWLQMLLYGAEHSGEYMRTEQEAKSAIPDWISNKDSND